jgi:hypothetical protein
MVLETTTRVSDAIKEEAEEAPESQPAPAAAAEPAATPRGEAFSPELVALLRKVVPAVWLLAAIAGGVMSSVAVGFLIAAAGALTLVITLMWTSVQSLTGGTALGFEEALGMGAPSKVEEEKRAVLRALKDLEFELSVGKISPEDYAELWAKYRAQARRLIQTVDETLAPARQEVEKAIAVRLEKARIPAEMPAETAPGEDDPPSDERDEPAKAGEDEDEDDEGEGDDQQPPPPTGKSEPHEPTENES